MYRYMYINNIIYLLYSKKQIKVACLELIILCTTAAVCELIIFVALGMK